MTLLRGGRELWMEGVVEGGSRGEEGVAEGGSRGEEGVVEGG